MFDTFSEEKNRQPLILVVDDLHGNIQVICNVLSRHNYKFATASSGHQALAFLEKRIPDLILLDIMMPEMDGIEVCSRIKSNPRTKDIPVIFLSSKSEAEDKVTGFDAGASDYVTKPFEPAVLIARVRNCLKLKFADETIKYQNSLLRETLRKRTQQLISSERRFAYGQLINNSVKEMEYIFSQTAEIAESMNTGVENLDGSEVDADQIQSCQKTIKYMISEFEKNIKKSSLRLKKITESLLSLDDENDDDKLELIDLNRILREKLTILDNEPLFKYIINKDIELSEDELMINIIPKEIEQIFLIFIMHAVDDFDSMEDASIFIRSILEGDNIKLIVGNNAGAKSPEEIDELFDPLYEVKSLYQAEDNNTRTNPNQNLYMVREILKPYTGSVDIYSRGDAGIDYIAIIPKYK